MTEQTEQMERLVTPADTQEITSKVRTPGRITAALAFSTAAAVPLRTAGAGGTAVLAVQRTFAGGPQH